MVLLTTTVFLGQLLCALVPCNPKYPLPDLTPVPGHDHDLGHGHGSDDVKEEFKSAPKSSIKDYLFKTLFHKILKEKQEFVGPIVHTGVGAVEGFKMKVVGGREIFAFEGIPYALPPLGNLRFQSPVPKPPWPGVLKAKGTPSVCLQYNVPKGFRILGKEDCLYLTIYTPQLPSDTDRPSLPVIFFIHGGGFFFGSSMFYGPSYFLQKDVILVIAQYRLGILGFLSSGDHHSPGNWGLKDQLLALKWVHSHIHAFGGDASRITLLGQSAGSAMVHYHILSEGSRGLFQNAVSMSGTALNYWAIHSRDQTANFTRTLAKRVGCLTGNEDSGEIVECLRNCNPVLLVQQTQYFLDDWPHPSDAWRPCIEPSAIEGNTNPFLTEDPLTLYARGDVEKVPWIVTLTSGEGYQFLLFPYITFQMKTLRKNWPRLAPDLADLELYANNLHIPEIVEDITRYYFHDVPPKKAPIHNFANIVTDRMFMWGIYIAAQLHSKIAPTYSYIFDVNGKYNVIENFGYPRETWGVGHAEDLFYIFNSSLFYHGFRREDQEFLVSEWLVNNFANFAKNGHPSYTTSDETEISLWEPHKGPFALDFLHIGLNGVQMVGDPYKDIVHFWDRFGIPDTPTQTMVQTAVSIR